MNRNQPNPALNLAPFGRWTLRDKAAQRRLALLIYGMTDKAEIDTLTQAVEDFRNRHDKRIPLQLTFYADLTKSRKITKIKLKGE